MARNKNREKENNKIQNEEEETLSEERLISLTGACGKSLKGTASVFM